MSGLKWKGEWGGGCMSGCCVWVHVPSVSAIIITPSLYRIASTLVPVTMG